MVQLKLSVAQERLMALWHGPVEKEPVSTRIPGLANLGNTCFMNAVLQCLLNTPGGLLAEVCRAFEESLRDGSENPSSSGAKVLVRSFAALVREYQATEGKALSKGNKALQNLKAGIATLDQQYAGCDQQDAYEFLGCLLDGLEEKFKVLQQLQQQSPQQSAAASGGVIREICGVTSYTTRTCHCCEERFEVDKVTDTAMRLPLISDAAVADAQLRAKEEDSPVSLQDLLAAAQKPEDIDGYDCDSCRAACHREGREHARSGMTQRAGAVCRTGDVLAIVLYRFCNTLDAAGNFKPAKVKRKVAFPTKLELDTGDYQLFGVVSHIGASLASGHYVAAVQSTRDGLWYTCDDEKVSPVNLKALYDGRPISGVQPGSDPYILFYQRCRAEGGSEGASDAATAEAQAPVPAESRADAQVAAEAMPSADRLARAQDEVKYADVAESEWQRSRLVQKLAAILR
eukprot:gb/GFBE01044022.1/.p1 GENE.gb/GFBE01044022.1/~~gb/GFBE01044022.1/.p1  ORF type:complete len:458 (+),score=120.98 gb/GFBE01044022.1/:1-1374(+)